MDSHGFGLDGIRLRCGAFRAVPATTSKCPARFLSAVLRSVAVVWNRSHRSWRGTEFILCVASPSTNPEYESGTRGATPYYDPGGDYISIPGPSRIGDGDLSDCAIQFWK